MQMAIQADPGSAGNGLQTKFYLKAKTNSSQNHEYSFQNTAPEFSDAR